MIYTHRFGKHFLLVFLPNHLSPVQKRMFLLSLCLSLPAVRTIWLEIMTGQYGVGFSSLTKVIKEIRVSVQQGDL